MAVKWGAVTASEALDGKGYQTPMSKVATEEPKYQLRVTKRLGQILVEKSLITPQELEHALGLQEEQGGRIGEILMKQGVIAA